MRGIVTMTMAFLAAVFCCKGAVVDTLSIASPYLGSAESVCVISPDSAYQKSCPTIYLLNGYDGNHLSWLQLTRPDLPELSDKYGVIFVMPDGRDSWYWNSPVVPDMQMESFFVEDLVPYIDSHYNTIPDSSHRAVTGLSMGGQGAFWLAINHPGVWKNVGSMSGGLNICKFPGKWKMSNWLGDYENNEDEWNRHAIVNNVSRIVPGELNIIFDCGTEDFFYEVNEQMHLNLADAEIPHEYSTRKGNHSHSYWADSIIDHIEFFLANFGK